MPTDPGSTAPCLIPPPARYTFTVPTGIMLPEAFISKFSAILGYAQMLQWRYGPEEVAHRYGGSIEDATVGLWEGLLEHCGVPSRA
jgi:hypothetical protein